MEGRCAAQIFECIDGHQAAYPISAVCRVLRVSRSGCYAWQKRPSSKRAGKDAMLTENTRQTHDGSRGTYRSTRVHAALQIKGIQVGKKRGGQPFERGSLKVGSRLLRSSETIRGEPCPISWTKTFLPTGPTISGWQTSRRYRLLAYRLRQGICIWPSSMPTAERALAGR